MPGVNFNLGGRVCHIDFAGEYKPGDARPDGYLDWYEWSEVQAKAGLKQKQCGRCGLWQWPQELSDVIDTSRPFYFEKGKKKYKVVREPVCLKCVEKVRST